VNAADYAITVVAGAVWIVTAPFYAVGSVPRRYKFWRRKRWFMKHWQFSEPYARAFAAKTTW
jgi:hypothetical protein